MISKKILLYYSFFFAIFLTISGVVASRSPAQVLLQVIFLPVTVYLGLMVFKDLRQKKQEINKKPAETKKALRLAKSLIFVLCLFSFLLITSIVRIVQETRSKTIESSSAISPIPLSKLKTRETTPTTYVIISPDDKRSLVNIRLSPSTAANVIKKAKSEEQYPLAGEEEKWYKIILENGSFGYVGKEVATISGAQEKKNK